MMFHLLAVGLLLGTTAGVDAGHSVRIDHASGAVDARYTSDVAIEHRQIGGVAPGGRPSTLRCVWSARLHVAREARHAAGGAMSRAIVRDDVMGGSRAGWCDGQRGAIAKEVAARRDELRDHLLAVAEEDRAVLHAEIDRLHGARTG